MKFIHDQLKKYEHHFLKGGKFEKLYPLWEANETFLFTPKTVTDSGPHVRDGLDSKRLMIMVVIALIPCVIMGALNAGYQTALAAGSSSSLSFSMFVEGMKVMLPIIIVSYVAGGVWEVLFSVVRKHEINEGFLVTGLLFPLTLPPTIPLWQVALGVSFGVVVGKEMFGGTGMNLLNPALTARAFLYFAYPAQISGDKVWIDLPAQAVDALNGATPLAVAASTVAGGDAAKTMVEHTAQAGMSYDLWHCFLGLVPGSLGETSALACLIGAVILILTGVGSWRIIVSCIGGAALTAALFNAVASDSLPGIFSMSPQYHLATGGLMFAAVFMATDPVSAARTTLGKYIYGFMIGMFTVLIRVVNPAFPEGAMLAVLFFNVFAPLIDHYVVQANIKRRLKRVAA